MDGLRAERARAALQRRLETRITSGGSITLPAAPAMADAYVERLARLFAALGRRLSDDERTHLESILGAELQKAFAQSQRSTITVSYRSPIGAGLSYTISAHCPTIEETYHEWAATREPPLFGVEPDARVWAAAQAAGDPALSPVLDIGAGAGRNALALAGRGHPVDAVELTAQFAEMIRGEAGHRGLDVRVIQRDAFATDHDLRRDYALIVLSEVVPEFRAVGELRALFELASRCLAPGGCLVFNAFLADPSYAPDDTAREFAELQYSAFFTRAEMSSACAGLPLELVADDSVHDYEKEHLPDGAWPPTGWYAEWVSGLDVFTTERQDCPIDMRWLVYRKV